MAWQAISHRAAGAVRSASAGSRAATAKVHRAVATAAPAPRLLLRHRLRRTLLDSLLGTHGEVIERAGDGGETNERARAG